mmetsp:Transcript_11371/g.24005  ORF Transcript_11371/g.24005 Transcript_11371/m.24005 type:complete len:82 (-) Transcript_11371:883-1128(-)
MVPVVLVLAIPVPAPMPILLVTIPRREQQNAPGFVNVEQVSDLMLVDSIFPNALLMLFPGAAAAESNGSQHWIPVENIEYR